VLFIGGGGFTGPKRFVSDYNVTVDVVEIDPEVIATSKEYFGVEESPRLDIHNMDGRQYLQETKEEYDLIVLDAYKKDQVPFHLPPVEFMRLVSSRLDSDGIVVSNLISAPRGSASAFYRAERKTMNQVFPTTYAFTTSGASVVQNIEIIATKRETGFTERELQARNDRRSVGIDLTEAIAGYQGSVPTEDVPVLRDDRAPVDRLLDPMLGRRYVIEGAGNETSGPNEANTTNTTNASVG
jgi:spermidine synthase